MADRTDMFRDAYDKRSGRKLPNRVPESHFDIFPNLRKTPTQKARDTTPTQATPAAPQAAPAAQKRS